MSPSETLLSLAERVEAASGADRELDALIGEALGWKPQSRQQRLSDQWYWDAPDGQFEPLPRFTASLDVAMSLVPAGHIWMLTNAGLDNPLAPGFGRATALVARPSDIRSKDIEAATPALALLAAALRAHASQSQEPGK